MYTVTHTNVIPWNVALSNRKIDRRNRYLRQCCLCIVTWLRSLVSATSETVRYRRRVRCSSRNTERWSSPRTYFTTSYYTSLTCTTSAWFATTPSHGPWCNCTGCRIDWRLKRWGSLMVNCKRTTALFGERLARVVRSGMTMVVLCCDVCSKCCVECGAARTMWSKLDRKKHTRCM